MIPALPVCIAYAVAKCSKVLNHRMTPAQDCLEGILSVLTGRQVQRLGRLAVQLGKIIVSRSTRIYGCIIASRTLIGQQAASAVHIHWQIENVLHYSEPYPIISKNCVGDSIGTP